MRVHSRRLHAVPALRKSRASTRGFVTFAVIRKEYSMQQNVGEAAKQRIAVVVSLVFALALGACGGGSSSSTSNLESAAGNSAMQAFYTAASTTTLTGTDNSGNTYSLTSVVTPSSGTTTFNAQTVYSATITTTLTVNGTPTTAALYSYFLENPFTPEGSEQANNSYEEVITPSATIPSTVSVGNTGTLATSTTYNVASGNIDGTTTYSYVVNALNANALDLCLIRAFVANPGNADNLSTTTETDCYAITAAGAASYASTIVISGSTTVNLN